MSKGKVAILGAGNGGQAAAADLTRRGFEVRLYAKSMSSPKMAAVVESKEIKFSGVLGEGVSKIHMLTSNLAEALDGVDFIFVAVPANGHLAYAKMLVPHLRDGQTVMIYAGNFASLVFWKEMKAQGIKKDVVFAETYTMAYDARLKAQGDVQILGTRKALITGVMPSKRTGEVIPKLQLYYPEIVAAKNVLDCALYTLNPVVHVPGCVMNCGRIENMKGEYWFYQEAISPAVGRVTEAMDAERMSIMRKLGLSPVSVVDAMSAAGSSGNNIHEVITSNKEWAKIKGPDGLRNRYFTEDIPFGAVPWACLAKAIGVPTPVMDSLINIGSWVMEENCWESGRNVAALGLEGMSMEQIQNYVEHGWFLG